MEDRYLLVFDQLWGLVPDTPGSQPAVLHEARNLMCELHSAEFWNANLDLKCTEVLSFLEILCSARKWRSYGADKAVALAQSAVGSLRIAFQVDRNKSLGLCPE